MLCKSMGLQSPHGQLTHIDRHPLLERKQQTGKTAVLKGIGFLESGALFEDAFQIVWTVWFACTPHPHPGTKSHGQEMGIPRTVGMLYRRAFQSVREALCGIGIPVWFV